MSNPCLKCPVDQSCCRELRGLTLSADEYHRLFEGKSDHLTITPKGKLYQVFSNGNGPCPHWDQQCQIYGDRPMDCDLYPYTIGNIFVGKKSVLATFHSRTECPLNEQLLQPREKAAESIHNFLEKVHGDGVKITVRYDEGAARLYHLGRRAVAKAQRLITQK